MVSQSQRFNSHSCHVRPLGRSKVATIVAMFNIAYENIVDDCTGGPKFQHMVL